MREPLFALGMSLDEAPLGRNESDEQPVPDPRAGTGPAQLARSAGPNTLLWSFLSFVVITFMVWLVSAGSRYRAEHAEATQGWRVGSTRSVELTLGRDDKQSLACASDRVIAGLRCAFSLNGNASGPTGPADPSILQPLNTVSNELMLASNLWNSPDLSGALPTERFTVICNYHIKGVVRTAAIRFSPRDAFTPLGKSVTVGVLTDCVIPQ